MVCTLALQIYSAVILSINTALNCIKIPLITSSLPSGSHPERGAVLLALVGKHLLDAADLYVGEVPADVGDEGMHAAAVERRLGGARLLAGARPALPRHRARGQLDGREQRRRQPPRHLPVVPPLHTSQQLLPYLYPLAEFYLKDNKISEPK